MALTTVPVAPGQAYPALAAALAAAKGDDPLAPVTVVVPTNASGVAARRWLGRQPHPWGHGIAAVDMLTLGRVAELLAGPELAASGRHPVSTPVVELALTAVLGSLPRSMYARVAGHPSTIVALGELYQEVRLAGPGATDRLRGSSARGAAAAEVIDALAGRLGGQWYDNADLLAGAADIARAGSFPARLGTLIVFLPHPALGLDAELLRALGQRAAVTVLFAVTGNAGVDAEVRAAAVALGVPLDPPGPGEHACEAAEIVSATDADEEVRHAVRHVLDAARRGVPFARMAILWPANEPYARLVEHHLQVAGLPWNGRPGTLASERIVPRLLTDLLDVDRRGLRRTDVFDLLADLDVRAPGGGHLPVARWERASRRAGVSSGADWAPRLARYAAAERQRAAAGGRPAAFGADDAEALSRYVVGLRGTLGRRDRTRPWADWVTWSVGQLSERLGDEFLAQLDEAEHLAHQHTGRVLERLGRLDAISPPVTRSQFRSVFAAEFDAAPGRLGRIGQGIAVGTLSGAVGLDVDLAIVLGAADGNMPPAPTSGPLLSDHDRLAAGLHPSDGPSWRMYRQFRAVLAGVPEVLITFPRGDLRGTAERHSSRWLAEVDAPVRELASHHAALRDTEFPAHPAEHRLRARLAERAQQPAGHDGVLARSLRMRAGRRSDRITEFDGDLSGVPIAHFSRPIAPTQLEQWVSCPHGYFVKHVLGVYPIDDPQAEHEIPPFERGNLVHYVLDQLHREVLAGTLPQPAGGWAPEHFARAVELFHATAAEFEASGRTGRPASWHVERAHLLADLLQWLARDSQYLAATGATIVSSEASFGRDGSVTIDLPSGPLAVSGQIDRVDRTSSGTIVVIDHKSGKADSYRKISADDPTAGGTRLQLPVYAAAAPALAGQPQPAAVEAYYAFFGAGRYERIGYALGPAVRAEITARFADVAEGIRAGLFVARPAAPGFQYRVECWYCQPDGLGTTERHPEWERKRRDPRGTRWFAELEADEELDP